MQVNQLKLNRDKTGVMWLVKPHDLLGTGTVIIDALQSPVLTQVCSLGVLLDLLLYLDIQVMAMARNAFHQIYLVEKL